jgi:hypothetical protein
MNTAALIGGEINNILENRGCGITNRIKNILIKNVDCETMMELNNSRMAWRATWIVFLVPVCVAAHILPSRNFTVDIRDTGRGFFTHTLFFGEAIRGFHSAGDDRAWEMTFGGVVELYRWDEHHALMTRFAQSTFANSNNDIHFNPRSVQWEENLGGMFHSERFDAEVGFSYRCKHDIDNSDPPDGDVPRDSGPAEKRVLILSGPYFTVIPQEWKPSGGVAIRSFLRSDFFILREDNRFPADVSRTIWTTAVNATTIGARLDIAAWRDVGLYSRDYATCIIASKKDERISANAHAECGVRFRGLSGALEIYAAYDRLCDDLSVPHARQSDVAAIGLRMAGNGVY